MCYTIVSKNCAKPFIGSQKRRKVSELVEIMICKNRF